MWNDNISFVVLQFIVLLSFLCQVLIAKQFVALRAASLIPVPSSFLSTFRIAEFRRNFLPNFRRTFRPKFRRIFSIIFFDFWCGRWRRAKNRKKCQVLRPSQPPIPPSQPPIPPEFNGRTDERTDERTEFPPNFRQNIFLGIKSVG